MPLLLFSAQPVGAGVSLVSVALMRYRFAVVDWWRDDRRREVQVLTDGGVHKAAWMAGDSFSYLHPRTPLRTIVLLWEREPEETPDGIAVVEPEDIQDLMELR